MSDPIPTPANSAGVIVGVPGGTRADLRRIAKDQKVILVCIAAYLAVFIGQIAMPQLQMVFMACAVVTVIVSAVFVFRLAIKLYGTVAGVLLGILALVPCVGFVVLYAVNSQATEVLQKNGIRVGLIGANLAEFPVES